MTPDRAQPTTVAPVYRRPWFRWAVGSIAVLFVGGGVVAGALYAIWRSSPEAALFNAAQYAAKTPGTYRIKAPATDVTLVVDHSGRYGLTGTVNDIALEAVASEDSLYVKTTQPDKLFSTVLQGQNAQVQRLMHVFAGMLADKWIHITTQSAAKQSSQAQLPACTTQVRSSLTHNPQAWGGVYLQNRFIQADSGSAATYTVSIDGRRLHAFLNTLQRADFYQSLAGCRDIKMPDTTPLQGMRATVTLSEARNMQSAVVTLPDKTTATITADYRNVPTVDVPKDAMNLDQLAGQYLQKFISLF